MEGNLSRLGANLSTGFTQPKVGTLGTVPLQWSFRYRMHRLSIKGKVFVDRRYLATEELMMIDFMHFWVAHSYSTSYSR